MTEFFFWVSCVFRCDGLFLFSLLCLLYSLFFLSCNLFLSLSVDDEGELHDNQLPRTLLLMHRWYVSSAELAGKLLIIYPVSAPCDCV